VKDDAETSPDLPSFQKVLLDTYDDKDFTKYVLEHYGMRFLDMCVKEVYGGSRHVTVFLFDPK
jgi:hypothetical protein